MAGRQQSDRLDELEDRVQALEDLFSPSIISRQTKHVDATKRDARKTLKEGQVAKMKVSDPPGNGDAPESAVGKVKGIVTFANCDGLEVEENDTIECRITDVGSNAANAIATQVVGN